MAKYEKFLAYWSLVVASVLLVVSLALPQPKNFFAFGLFLPVALYFWLRFSLAGETNPYRWSLKMLGILLVGGILGIFAFRLAETKPNLPPSPPPAQTAKTTEETKVLGEENQQSLNSNLEEIKTELLQIKAEQRALRELLEISGSAQSVVEILNRILEATGSALP
jgi:hypothetical protein